MNCTVTPLRSLDADSLAWIAGRLCWFGSDFYKKLTTATPTLADGTIAVVRDFGEIVGWARTEKWQGHDTLEAFVSPQYRQRGVAAYAASGLVASAAFDGRCAVFEPRVLLLARRAGLLPRLFKKDADGVWRPA